MNLSIKDTAHALLRMRQGEEFDLSIRGNGVRSSKTAYAVIVSVDDRPEWRKPDYEYEYRIIHDIDGTITRLSEAAMAEVLRGERDPWEGDL